MNNDNMETINVVIGKNMTELRKTLNLSQREVCEAIGINRNTYKDYETGRRMVPLPILSELAKIYKVSFDYFFNDMPSLSDEEKRKLFVYSSGVERVYNSPKYSTIDVSSSKKVLDYFEKEQEKLQGKIRIRVKKLRLENNKTQNDIAKYLGVVKSTYNKYENGKRKFNNETIKKLAEYYNINVSDIVD